LKYLQEFEPSIVNSTWSL